MRAKFVNGRVGVALYVAVPPVLIGVVTVVGVPTLMSVERCRLLPCTYW